MDAITAITERVSVAQLTGPGPSDEQMKVLYQAAFRAPDHGRLRPWRYLTIKGSGLEKLGEVFSHAGALKDGSLSQEKLTKLKKMPLRAPVIVVAIAKVQSHEKVPAQEQVLAAGAGVQNLITAAYALGLGAMWRTGEMAYDDYVRQSLGLEADEEIIGFIYLGHVNCRLKNPPVLAVDDFVTQWNGIS